jgi:uncharacterized protein (TIGR03437 family)
MKRLLPIGFLLIAAGATAFAQAPVITDVLDAGGYTATIPQGGVFVVKGSNLAASSSSATSPYPTSLNGVSITFTAVTGGAQVKALMVYTYSQGGVTQLAGVLPAGTVAADYNVTVTTGAGTSAAFKVTVVVRKFGVITVPGSGSGRAVILNILPSGSVAVNRFTTGQLTYQGTVYTYAPAYPTQTVTVFGTGLGGTVTDSTVVIVGNLEIKPLYAGPSDPQYPGLDQINVTLPANVSAGCNIPFQVRVGTQLSNSTTISIAPNARVDACNDGLFSRDLLTRLDGGGTFTVGSFSLNSFSATVMQMGLTLSTRSESASGGFARYTADQLGFIPSALAATAGACVVSRITTLPGIITAIPDIVYLDAGTVSLNGPNVSNKAFTETSNVYSLSLGTAISGLPPGVPLPPGFNASPLIAPGTYTVTGAGGKDVGVFSARVDVNQPLTVTGGLPTTVVRAQNLPIAWTGGGTDVVAISGSSATLLSGSASAGNAVYDLGTFYCTTTADKLSFTVPSSILLQLPPTPANALTAGTGFGALSVSTSTVPRVGNGLFSAPLTAGGNTDYAVFLAGIGTASAPAYQ